MESSCSICGIDAEAGVNVFTVAGESFSKVAATFTVGRSAVYRHRKHAAERVLVDKEGARRLMREVQGFADRLTPPVDLADLWRHIAHKEYPDIPADPDGKPAWGAAVLAAGGIEPYRSQFLKGLEGMYLSNSRNAAK